MPDKISPEKLAELSELIFNGRKIEAIKEYRELTNVGLKESKDEIEALESALRKTSPEKFVATPKGKGCLGGAAMLCVLIAVACWIAFR